MLEEHERRKTPRVNREARYLRHPWHIIWLQHFANLDSCFRGLVSGQNEPIIEKISPQLAAVGVVSTGTVLRSKNGGAH